MTYTLKKSTTAKMGTVPRYDNALKQRGTVPRRVSALKEQLLEAAPFYDINFIFKALTAASVRFLASNF